MAHDLEEEQLAAEVQYAAERLALYRRRIYAGTSDPHRLAELERVASGAAERLARHRAAVASARDRQAGGPAPSG